MGVVTVWHYEDNNGCGLGVWPLKAPPRGIHIIIVPIVIYTLSYPGITMATDDVITATDDVIHIV